MHEAIDYLKKGTPINDRLVVLPDEQEQKTKSGVILAQTNRGEDTTQVGTIIAVGPGRYPDNSTERQPMDSKVGDRILFSKHAGDEFKIDMDLKIYPAHTELREGLLTIKILLQDSILYTFPHETST